MSAHMTDPVAPEEPLSEGGFRYSDRAAILCRTCLRPLTWETRTEPGYLPRTGWYDDARSDPLICFKAVSYRHEPLTDREWAYYEAGQRNAREQAEAVDFTSRRLGMAFPDPWREGWNRALEVAQADLRLALEARVIPPGGPDA